MMSPADVANGWWFAGWLVAVGALTILAFQIPLYLRIGRAWPPSISIVILVLAVAVGVLANVALALHDLHFDVTAEKTHTPSPAALATVDALDRPVRLTYFYQAKDEGAQRAREVVELMGRRNSRLTVQTIDPDMKPAAATRYGARMYNTAVLEADGRRIFVPGVDETQIAIGIQRVLRQRVVPVCFIEGHGEFEVNNLEFHDHLEGVASHSHSDGTSQIINTTGHGIGRFGRVLEDLGYEVRRITPATQDIPSGCAVVVVANPRQMWLPGESIALEQYLEGGGSALLMLDVGFELEPQLHRLMTRLGVATEQVVVQDPRSNYGKDPEMVAVTGYVPHPITKSSSITLFPGARPLKLTAAKGVTAVPIVATGSESVTRPLNDLPATRAPGARVAPGPQVIAAALEAKLGASVSRIVVTGDADFASNSFLPYMANKELAVSMVRWLSREEKLTSISPRIPTPALVLLTQGQMQSVFLFVAVLPPLCVLLLGAFVWWRRR